MPATVLKYKPANFKRKGQRDAGDIVLFSGASASKLRLDVDAGREMPVAFLSRAAAAN